MGKFQGASEGSSCSETGLLSSIQRKTTSDPVSDHQKQLFGSSEAKSFAGGGSTNGSKKGSGSGSKQELSQILQSFVSGSKTRKQMATSNRSQCGKYILTCSHFQNGNCRSHSGFSSSRRVGGFTDAYFHVPIHQKFQKYLRFHVQGQAYQFRALPFGIATAPLEFTRVVKEVKFIALSQGVRIHQYLDDWLVRAKDPDSCARDVQKLISLVGKLGWIVNLKKSELNPTQDLEFLGYRFNLREGLVYPNQKKLDKLKILAVSILQGHNTTPRKLMSLIGVMASMEKTVPLGRIHMRPFQWFLKTNWQFPQSLDKVVPISQLIKDHLAWWMDPQNLLKGSNLHQKEHNILMFTDASEKGWGAHLNNCTVSGFWQPSEKDFHINILELKAVFSSSETFSRTIKAKNSIGFFRQLNCGLLYQQGRRHSLLRNVCFDVENSGLVQCQGDPDQGQTYSRESQCDSRFPVQEGQGHSDRVVFASSGLSRNLPSLAQANGGSVCHQLECQASNLRISCPRRQGLADRCIEHLLGGSGRLCFLSSSHPSSVSSENDHLQVQGHCDSTRVARDALVLGSGGIVSQDSTEASSNAQSPEATLQSQIPQESGVAEPPCLVSGLLQEGQGGFSVEVADRIKAPQRQSSRRVYDSRWAIFQKWARENQVDVTKPTIPQIADFLNHLFTDRNLKPRTIAGYRTSVADGLGSAGQMVSQSLDLNRLIASFHRDRPSANRSIPNWDLSLVLLALTRAPFEPLGKADLKILTFKTVFLLALASGKRRSEIHAWTFDSFSRKRDWSEVTFSPSTAFIAKNQLASEGPLAIQPVVIPALKPTLDPSLIQDKSLCPVRALRYYLDKTKDLRKGKKLLFVAIKEGYSKDISKATISSWIKQSIILAYQKSDQEVQNVSQVKAHEVRALAASLAFKGGVALDEIMASCFWRSHSTFTNFYLKDLYWHNGDVMKIGPVVAAQHVVNC